MIPEQVDTVERTFALLGPITQATGEAFYAKLFQIDPSTKPLFGVDMDEQARRLMQVLAFAVNHLRAQETLLPVVRDLGRRHYGYGVTDAHYDSVRVALLGTIAAALGDEWSGEVESAWNAAYTTIAEEMKAAAHEAGAA